MARCQAITRNGQRCRLEALPGSSFCWVHRNRCSQNVITPVVLGTDMVRVRYLGRTPYIAFGQEFGPFAEVRLLPAAQARFLAEHLPQLFRLEE